MIISLGPPVGLTHGCTTGRGFYRSDDGGEHWVRLEHGLPAQFDVMVRQIALDEAGTLSIAAGQELFVSQDEGDSWRRLGGELFTVQALAVV